MNAPWKLLKNDQSTLIVKFIYSSDYYEFWISNFNECWYEKLDCRSNLQIKLEQLNSGIEIENEKLLLMIDKALSNSNTIFSFQQPANQESAHQLNNTGQQVINRRKKSVKVSQKQSTAGEMKATVDESEFESVLSITWTVQQLQLQWKFLTCRCDHVSFSDNLLKPIMSFNGWLIQQLTSQYSNCEPNKNCSKTADINEPKLSELLFSPAGENLYLKFLEYCNQIEATNIDQSVDKAKEVDGHKLNTSLSLSNAKNPLEESEKKKQKEDEIISNDSKKIKIDSVEKRKEELQTKLNEERTKKLHKQKKFKL